MARPLFYLFDMDHTLIKADCDVTWKYFVVKHQLAPASALSEADRFFDDYNRGELDVNAFYEFQFREFAGRTEVEMAALAEQHFMEYIRPNLYPEARRTVENAKAAGVPVGILSSTNTVISTPVARALGIDLVLGTRLEVTDGHYTGRITGTYGAGPGKVTIAGALAMERGLSLRDFAYFGDSINDRNILEAVGFPTAVNPSDSLKRLASERGWPIVAWAL